MDAPGSEPSLRHREALALGAEHVRDGHPDAVEADLRVAAVIAIVEAENRERSDDGHARGVAWDEDHALLAMPFGARIRLAHDDEQRRVGVHGAVDHHFRPVITYSSPSRPMLVWMLVASEEATSGSDMQNDDRMRPSSSGMSHSAFCVGVP